MNMLLLNKDYTVDDKLIAILSVSFLLSLVGVIAFYINNKIAQDLDQQQAPVRRRYGIINKRR